MFDENDEAVEESPEAAASGTAPATNSRFGEIPEGFFNINGASEYLGISAMRIRRIVKNGRVEGAYQEEDTGRWIIPAEGLDTYKQAKGVRTGGKSYVFKLNTDEFELSAVLAALEPFGITEVTPRYKTKEEKAAAAEAKAEAAEAE